MNTLSLTDKIDALLPQTQCRECGYPACHPYAEAIANQQADIDLCAPGGQATLQQVAALVEHEATQKEVAYAEAHYRAPSLASIREDECIGCTKCIQACPVDAIIGSNKHMHVILAQECTGCGLCVEPCPVDCIDLSPIEKANYDRDKAKQRYVAREQRLAKTQRKRAIDSRTKKKDYIAAALARALPQHSRGDDNS